MNRNCENTEQLRMIKKNYKQVLKKSANIPLTHLIKGVMNYHEEFYFYFP